MSRGYIRFACRKRWRVDADALVMEIRQAAEHILLDEAPCQRCDAWYPMSELQPDDADDPAPSHLCPECLSEVLAQQRAYEARPLPREKPGIIYLIRNPRSGYIKIGRTVNLASRKPMIDKMHGVVYEVIHVIDTDSPRELERRLHARFADQRRSKKELFELSKTDLAVLCKIKQWNVLGSKDQIRFVVGSAEAEQPNCDPPAHAFQVQEETPFS